jgi:Flp pilus assembly protein CpaB
LILIAAVVVGLLSAYLVYNYVQGADDRAREDAEVVEVLRVVRDIPRGTTGAEVDEGDYLEEDEITVDFRPATAVPPDEADTILTKVAVSDIAAGQVLVDNMFADPVEAQTGFTDRVPEGQVAITMSFDSTRGVAGVVVPGDYVNILVSPDTETCGSLTPEEDATQAQEEGGEQVTVIEGADKRVAEVPLPPAQAQQLPARNPIYCTPARYLFQSVQVLFIDKETVPLPGEDPEEEEQQSVDTGLITFAVPPKAAQILASVNAEDLYLTLLPRSYDPVALPVLDPFPALLPGENPAEVTPYGPDGFQE